MEKIDVNDFLKLKRKYKNELLRKISDELCKEICNLKNIKFDGDLNSTASEIYYNSIYFSEFEDYCKDASFIINNKMKRIKKTEFGSVISHYNYYVAKIKEYKELKDRIEKEGFSNIEKKYKENLRSLFIKMLDFKNRKYDKNEDITDLVVEINLCYSDYEYIWVPLDQLLNDKCIYRDTIIDEFWMIKADDVEYLDILNDIYEYFTNDEDLYKNYNQFNEDITLEENQTVEDLYKLELERIKNLFIEMLKYKNIEIEDYDYQSLKSQVMNHYKRFLSSFIHYEVVLEADVHSTYVDMINEIRRTYKFLENNYKK